MDKREKTGKIVGALLLGAVAGGFIGATLGLLLAPARGSETRKKLFAKGDKLSGTVKEKFNDFVEEMKKEVVSAKSKSAELAGNGDPGIKKST